MKNDFNFFCFVHIHIHIQNGHLNLVEFLIEKKSANIHLKDYYGDTPFWIASEVCLFSFFLSNSLKRESYLRFVLNQNGHVDIVKFLFEKGAKVDLVAPGGKTLLWIVTYV